MELPPNEWLPRALGGSCWNWACPAADDGAPPNNANVVGDTLAADAAGGDTGRTEGERLVPLLLSALGGGSLLPFFFDVGLLLFRRFPRRPFFFTNMLYTLIVTSEPRKPNWLIGSRAYEAAAERQLRLPIFLISLIR